MGAGTARGGACLLISGKVRKKYGICCICGCIAFAFYITAFAQLAFSLWVIFGIFPCFARLAWLCEGFFSCFLRFCPACFLFVGYLGNFFLFRPACSLLVGYFLLFSIISPILSGFLEYFPRFSPISTTYLIMISGLKGQKSFALAR